MYYNKKFFTLLASLLFSAVTTQADVITLTTSKATNEKIKMAVNACGEVSLTWGNGDSQTLKFSGRPVEIEVKDSTLTLTSEKAITLFYAPDAGIKTLDLSEATALEKLVVPDNGLTTLNLNRHKALRVVELQNNSLSSLSLNGRSTPEVEYINCANNQLTSLTVPAGSAARLHTLICTNNLLTKMPSLASVETIETVWVGQNACTGEMKLGAASRLRSLNMEDNDFDALSVATLANLEGLWAKGNQLTSLDFSEGVPFLKDLSVAGNQLTQVLWSRNNISEMNYINLSGNNLYFGSFPIINEVQKIVLAPQNPFFFTDTINVNENFGDEEWTLFSNKRMDNSRSFAMYDSEGNALTKGSSGDYNHTKRGVFTFFTPQEGAYFIVTSSKFEDVELRSLPFCVFDPETGIEEIHTDKTDTSAIYDLQGRLLTGSTDNLPAGIYIVNGKKTMLK